MANSFNTYPVFLDTDTSTGGNTNWRGTSGCTLAGIGSHGIKPYKILVTPAAAGTVVATGTIAVTDPQQSSGNLLTIPITAPVAANPWIDIEIDLSNSAVLWRDFVVTGLSSATKAALQIWYRV